MTMVAEDFLLNGQWLRKVFSPMVSPMVMAIKELLPNGQPNGHGHLENFPNGQWSRPFRIDHMENPSMDTAIHCCITVPSSRNRAEQSIA